MTAKKDIPNTEFDTLMIQVANKLKELRINAGYSSYENFAWDNNINRMQYWKMEKGETNFTMKSLHKILSAHKLSIAEFFKDFE
jgi:DNA-binding XRE family transcriptional regulator